MCLPCYSDLLIVRDIFEQGIGRKAPEARFGKVIKAKGKAKPKAEPKPSLVRPGGGSKFRALDINNALQTCMLTRAPA